MVWFRLRNIAPMRLILCVFNLDVACELGILSLLHMSFLFVLCMHFHQLRKPDGMRGLVSVTKTDQFEVCEKPTRLSLRHAGRMCRCGFTAPSLIGSRIAIIAPHSCSRRHLQITYQRVWSAAVGNLEAFTDEHTSIYVADISRVLFASSETENIVG